MSFRCPLCKATVFEQLPAGPPPASRPLFTCAGCSVVFTDPKRIAADPGVVPGQPSAAPSFARLHTPAKPANGRSRGRRDRSA